MTRYMYRLARIRNLVLLTMISVPLAISILSKMFRNMKLSRNNTASQDAFDSQNYIPDFKEIFVIKSMKKIDWHDYAQMNRDSESVGIGEQGLTAYMPESEAELEKKLYAGNGFNGALSDKIPLNRSIPDIRHRGCSKRLYIESLPTVSVVVPFHNEHWSTLLRTAFSVMHRSPDHLIKEVLLVDDASTKDFLKDRLDFYLARHMPRVRVIRMAKRSGLIAARLAGARQATGDVLLFLDSHIEVNVNWLPPLLEPIALDYRTAVCPFIDVIAYDTFEYRAQDEGARGAFDWEFFYKRLPVLPKDEKNMPEPFESPVMAGGLFAISTVFFWELGGYDPGLDIWGGEQYELSFKIWQCGGRMLDAPCSRVGHIYRKFACFPDPGHGDFVGKNYRRVAEVWMDEYAEHLYERRPHYRSIDTGDISEQKALRIKLNCKSFKWFMTQIAFDLTAHYPPVEPKPFAQGRIRPAMLQDWCVVAHGEDADELVLHECASAACSEVEFVLSWHKDIKSKSRNICWDLPESSPKSPILLYSCHLGGGNQMWRFIPETKEIQQVHSDTCVEFHPTTRALYINKCTTKDNQMWTIDTIDKEMMGKWDDTRLTVTGPTTWGLTSSYTPARPKLFAEGRIRPVASPAWCIDAAHGAGVALTLRTCVGAGMGVEFVLSLNKDIKSKYRNICWDLPESSPKSPIQLYCCHLGGGNQMWRFIPETKEIKQGTNGINCVEFDPDTRGLYINTCSLTIYQMWTIDTVDKEMMDQWDNLRSLLTSPMSISIEPMTVQG